MGFPVPAPALVFWPFAGSVQWWVACHAALVTLAYLSTRKPVPGP